MKLGVRLPIAILIVVLLASSAFGAPVWQQRPTGYVNDFAHGSRQEKSIPRLALSERGVVAADRLFLRTEHYGRRLHESGAPAIAMLQWQHWARLGMRFSMQHRDRVRLSETLL